MQEGRHLIAFSESARVRSSTSPALCASLSMHPAQAPVFSVTHRLPGYISYCFLKSAYCPRISVEGLMTIGPNTGDEREVRAAFEGLRLLRDKLRTLSGLSLDELSMGMSGDYEIAIEEGSTIVRIGTGIFGFRP